jgi:hypothetical protein
MKSGRSLSTNPALAAERRARREQRRASDPPRPEDLNREARRAAREAARSQPTALTTDRKPRTPLKRTAMATATKRRPISEASPEQRAAVAIKACVVCRESPTDPAHLLPRGLCPDGDGDPRAVVPLCRDHHREYDEGGLDLLPYLEPWHRTELAFAVERFGLLSTLRRVTNQREAARP